MTEPNEPPGHPDQPQLGASDFSTLYQAHARHVHRFALFLSGDPALADDLLSETFIRVWNARKRVDLTTVRSYLFAIARNLFLEHRRRGRPVALDDRVTDPQPGPERRASARRELALVIAGLQALPEMDRAAVLMRADDAMSYDQIAAALGISSAAARVKVHRARMKLATARLGGASSVGSKETR